MPLYWTIKDIPELSKLSVSERDHIWKKIYWKTFLHWQTWSGIAAFFICCGLGIYLGRLLGHEIIGGMFGGGVGGFVFSQAQIYAARRFYSDQLLGNLPAGSP